MGEGWRTQQEGSAGCKGSQGGRQAGAAVAQQSRQLAATAVGQTGLHISLPSSPEHAAQLMHQPSRLLG